MDESLNAAIIVADVVIAAAVVVVDEIVPDFELAAGEQKARNAAE